MPAAVAVRGRARAGSSWLNLVERLGFGADDQLAAAWHPSQRPGAGWSIRDRVELCGAVLGRAHRDRRNTGGLSRVLHQRTWATPTCSRSQSPRV
jgi:hypothetical protein